jgi:hypothetical protein
LSPFGIQTTSLVSSSGQKQTYSISLEVSLTFEEAMKANGDGEVREGGLGERPHGRSQHCDIYGKTGHNAPSYQVNVDKC